MANYVYNDNPVYQPAYQDTSNSTLNKIGTIAQGAGGLITSIDRALHPDKYQYPQAQQPQQYPVYAQQQQSGFGWGEALLLLGVGAGLIYGGKELLDSKKKSKKSKK
jgi:hypothetical protein